MPDPRARLYELALRALDEQDRQVSDVRGRLAPVLAAGGVGLTLLTRPVFTGSHPSGTTEVAATAIGLVGAVVLVLACAYLRQPREIGFSLNPPAAYLALNARGPETLENDELFYETMISTLTRRRAVNQPIVDRLHTAFSIALLGLLAELAGLALAAALAS